MNKDELQKELIEIKSEMKQLKQRVIKIENELGIPEECKTENKFKKPELISSISTLQSNIKEKIPTKKENKNRDNIEGNIGKKLMGIFASILIFIGVTSFIALIYASIPEIVKFSIMWLFTFIFLGFGLYKTQKEKNPFSLSISGCGIGLIYISLLLSFFYFKYIPNEIILFSLMIFWSMAVLYLSKNYKSNIFAIISYIGFTFSLCLGAMSSYGGIPIISTLLLVSNALFSLFINSTKFNASEKLNKNFPYFSYISTIILSLIITSELDGILNNFLSFDFIIILIGISFSVTTNLLITNKNKELSNIKNILLFISNTLLLTLSINIFEWDIFRNISPIFANTINTSKMYGNIYRSDFISLITAISSLIHFIFFNYKKTKKFFIYASYFIFLFSLMNSGVLEILIAFGLLSIVSIIFMTIGIKEKDNYFQTTSLITLLLNIFYVSSELSYRIMELNNEVFIFYCIITILPIIGFFIIQNKILNKKIFYLVYIFSIGIFFEMIGLQIKENILYFDNTLIYNEESLIYKTCIYLPELLSYLSISLFYFLQRLIPVLKKNRNEFILLEKIAVLGLTVFGISLIHEIDFNELIRFIVIMISGIQCFINNKEILKIDNKFAGYYVGIKTTLYLNLVLHAFLLGTEMNYIYSITCLLIALISIISGFKTDSSSLRFYGLALSIFSVFKLILIDITYTNSITRILSFIGSGLICFFIVWIYNKMQENNM